MTTEIALPAVPSGGLFRQCRHIWETYWFQPASPQGLALCRILFYGMLLYYYWGEDFRYVTEMAPLSWKSVSIFKILGSRGVLPAETLGWLQLLWKISLFTSMIGLRTRLSTATACILAFYLIPLTYSVARMCHETPSMGFCLVILALARCGDAFSLDRLIARKYGNPVIPEWSFEYRWPIRLVRVAISLIFLSAGYFKAQRSGLEWVLSDNFQLLLAGRNFGLGAIIYTWPVTCRLLAGGALAIELFHPLALFSKKLAVILVPSGLLMILGFYFIMGIPFPILFCVHLFWIPWDRVLPALRRG
jgi:hypothetical protein